MVGQDPIKTGIFHRNGQEVKTPRCQMPHCTNHIIPEAKQPICPDCDIFIQRVIFVLDNVHREEPPDPKQTDDRRLLLVPKAGMEKEAIAEALRQSKNIAMLPEK